MDGYTFISNSNQEEIEYYYLEQDKFNEEDIKILNLKSYKVSTQKQEDKNNTCFVNSTNEIKNFTIIKENYKAVILKMNINNLTNFIITRKEYKIYKESNENNSSKVMLIVIISIITIILVISIFIIYIILKKKKKNINNSDCITNEIKNNTSKNELTPVDVKNDINNIELSSTPLLSDNDRGINENIIKNEKPKKLEENKSTSKIINDNPLENYIDNRNSINSEGNSFAPPPIAQNFEYKNEY